MTVGAKQDALPAPVSDVVPIPTEAKTDEAEKIHSVKEMEAETAPEGNDKTGYYRRYAFALME